mmetsp:Transcript_18673/g.37902  ORF Transcript_18673/g.37902 Transcript_18673/m.37902 type:complete len:296 (-) Transcript_18673:1503-2390(-)
MFDEPESVIFAELFHQSGDEVGIEQFSNEPEKVVIVNDPRVEALSGEESNDVVCAVHRRHSHVDDQSFDDESNRDANNEAHCEELDHGVETEVASVKDPKHNHEDQETLNERCSQHHDISPREPSVNQHGSRHQRRNDEKPQENIPTEPAQSGIMLHPRPRRASHVPPPHVVDVLGVFVKGLMGQEIDPLHFGGEEQSRLSRFLRQGADGEELTPAFAEHSAAALEDGVHGSSHEISSLSFFCVVPDCPANRRRRRRRRRRNRRNAPPDCPRDNIQRECDCTLHRIYPPVRGNSP